MLFTQKGKVYALILLASFLFSISTVTFGFFPYLGLSLSFIIFTILAYYIKKDKTALTKIFFAITLILSSFLVIRSEGSVTLLNIVALFYFGSLMVLIGKLNEPYSIFAIIFAPFTLFLKSIYANNIYKLDFKDSVSEEKKKENVLNNIAIILITLVTLVIILPLLSSANPFFERSLSNIVELLGLNNLKLTQNLLQWAFRLIVFVLLAMFVPKMATLINQRDDLPKGDNIGLNLLVPKIVVAIVLVIFFITQIQLYFASPEILDKLGYTLSQYTNEVFAQLSAVAAIVLVLLYFDKENKKVNKNMTLALIFQGIFLTLMAYKSDFDYINAWGFTYKGFTD